MAKTMEDFEDYYGHPLKTGIIYRSVADKTIVAYFDPDSSMIIKSDGWREGLSYSLCKDLKPLKDPKQYAFSLKRTANFIESKLKTLTNNNKPNLSEQEDEHQKTMNSLDEGIAILKKLPTPFNKNRE